MPTFVCMSVKLCDLNHYYPMLLFITPMKISENLSFPRVCWGKEKEYLGQTV